MLHQFPGFAELCVSRPAGVWGKAQRLTTFDYDSGKNVPDVLGKNVAGEKIDVLRGIGKFVRVYRTQSIVRPSRVFVPDRFYLHAPEHFAEANDKVVTFTVSPRLGYSVSAAGGFAHKGKLGEFAAMFIVQSCVRRF